MLFPASLYMDKENETESRLLALTESRRSHAESTR